MNFVEPFYTGTYLNCVSCVFGCHTILNIPS